MPAKLKSARATTAVAAPSAAPASASSQDLERVADFDQFRRASQEEAAARIEVVRELERFIDKGFRPLAGRAPSATVRGVCNLHVVACTDLLLRASASGLTPEDAKARVQASFIQSFNTVSQRLRTNVPPLDFDKLHAGLEVSSTVEGALQMAKFNHGRALQRHVALEVLCGSLPESLLAGLHEKEVLDGAERVLQELNAQACRFKRDVLRFAILLGGHALEEQRESIAAFFARKKLSLIGHLTVDGGIPSSWPSSLEDAFYADLQKVGARVRYT